MLLGIEKGSSMVALEAEGSGVAWGLTEAAETAPCREYPDAGGVFEDAGEPLYPKVVRVIGVNGLTPPKTSTSILPASETSGGVLEGPKVAVEMSIIGSEPKEYGCICSWLVRLK
jgi:hypothetical protein